LSDISIIDASIILLNGNINSIEKLLTVHVGIPQTFLSNHRYLYTAFQTVVEILVQGGA
jgi:hypothetical protein